MGETRQQALADHVVERLEGEVRVDGAGAVAQEQRHVVHFPRVTGFDDERAARPLAMPHQVMMDAGRREQAGDGREGAGDAAIGEDQDGVAVLHGRARSSQSSLIADSSAKPPPLASYSSGSVRDVKPCAPSMCRSFAS